MKLVDLIFFGRPMLVIPVWTVYLHYLSLNFNTDYLNIFPGREAFFHLVILTLIFKGTYVFNQIFDIESDRINDKLFFLPRGIISLKTAWVYFFVLNVCGIVLAVWLCPDTIRAVMAIIILGVLYSVPGVRLKDSPVGGLAANAVAYGLLIPWMVISGNPDIISRVGMIPYFMAIAAGYILTTIPDQEGDLATGKRTLAVILGPRGALWLALLTAFATLGLSFWTGNIEMAVVAGVTVVCAVYLLISFKYRVLMFACKFPILLLTLFAAAHYLFYGALLLLTILLTKFYYKRRFGIVYPELS